MMAEEEVATELAGQTINQYQIISHLGTGGMGEVYLAEDTRLARRVALKFLPAHLTQDKRHLYRFQQEARAVAALSHPNVCMIHEVVETGEGRHCIVMEYVEGVTLRERIAEGRMKIGEALDAAVQVASALAVAHDAGIVHRDVKPENVMLRRDGYVKVLDFGLAKLTVSGFANDAVDGITRSVMETNPGVVLGTFSYMSPEQARGGTIDVRSDIFSLGVMLYEMVAGRLPFTGATPADVLGAILYVEAIPLSAVSSAPDTLVRVVGQAVSKRSEARHQTMDGLVADLKAVRRQIELVPLGGFSSSPS